MTGSITCPRCGMTSYNPNDVSEGYCGNCNDYTRDSILCCEPGCTTWSVVTINGRRVCIDHVDAAMEAATGPLRQALSQINEKE